MFRAGKLFDKDKPILYLSLSFIAVSVIGSLLHTAWIGHGYVFTDWFLQNAFEYSGAFLYLFGGAVALFYCWRRKWSAKVLTLTAILLTLGFVVFLSKSGLLAEKTTAAAAASTTATTFKAAPDSTAEISSFSSSSAAQPVQTAELTGMRVVFIPGPSAYSTKLSTCPMLRLERSTFGNKMREYKTLAIIPHGMQARFEIDEKSRKIRLIAPSCDIFREIVVEFEPSWTANINKPTTRFDF